MSDNKPNWDQRLTEQVEKRHDNYFHRRIDLGQARSDESWFLAGEYIYVEKASSNSALAKIRFDKTNNEQLDLLRGVEIKTVFQRFYVTNEAQSGEWLELIIGINFEYSKPDQSELQEAQPVITQACILANTNYQLAAQPCNIVTIKADVQNLGIIWVDFGAAAVQGSCLPLDPGDWHIESVSNLNRLNFNAEIAGDDIEVVPVY